MRSLNILIILFLKYTSCFGDWNSWSVSSYHIIRDYSDQLEENV